MVPAELVPFTPIFLLATAGVRLLPELERNALLKEICSYTRSKTDFLLPDCDLHIQVIPGETEGLYGWVAANYLLGGFDAPERHNHGKGHHTYGFLDMGGASAQIAFAPNATEADAHADDLKLLRLRNVNGAVGEYKVYSTTWLGFGVNEARKRYVEALIEGEVPLHGELPDPCLPTGLTISTAGDVLSPDKIDGKEIHLIGTGKFEECLAKSYPLLGKEVPCEVAPCLLNGIHAPTIDFEINHFVGVSEYWHTTHEIFEYGHTDKAYDVATFQERVSSFCSRDWTQIQDDIKTEKWGHKVDEAKATEACFKANWIINVLHEGIGIPRVGLEATNGHASSNGTKDILGGARDKGFTDPFQAVNKIDDAEVSWTLGKVLLYASSEVPPSKTNNLPVGFGSNVAGIPADFQYAGVPHLVSIRPNATRPHGPLESDGDGWHDTLFEGQNPKRVPGFFFFLIIIVVAIFLLCGKDRRNRFFRNCFSRCMGPGGRNTRHPRWLPFTIPKVSFNGADERLLEGGMADPHDFELGDMQDEPGEDSYSDDSTSSKTGKTSGWATPSLRATPKLDPFLSLGGSSSGGGSSSDLLGGISSAGKNLGLGINAMDRSGLFVRTESRERLVGVDDREREVERKSRRGSPTRAFTRSPLMKRLAED